MPDKFPLSHLLYLNEIARDADVYCDHMEGFRLLVEWLGPIDIPSGRIPYYKLHGSYTLNQMASILNTTPGQILYGYQTTTAILQFPPYVTQMSKKIPTIQTEL